MTFPVHLDLAPAHLGILAGVRDGIGAHAGHALARTIREHRAMTDVLVIVDTHERTESGIAVLSGVVAGTLARVSVACDRRAVAPVLDALARGERVPVNVEPWQVIAGDVPPTMPEATA